MGLEKLKRYRAAQSFIARQPDQATTSGGEHPLKVYNAATH